MPRVVLKIGCKGSDHRLRDPSQPSLHADAPCYTTEEILTQIALRGNPIGLGSDSQNKKPPHQKKEVSANENHVVNRTSSQNSATDRPAPVTSKLGG